MLSRARMGFMSSSAAATARDIRSATRRSPNDLAACWGREVKDSLGMMMGTRSRKN